MSSFLNANRHNGDTAERKADLVPLTGEEGRGQSPSHRSTPTPSDTIGHLMTVKNSPKQIIQGTVKTIQRDSDPVWVDMEGSPSK